MSVTVVVDTDVMDIVDKMLCDSDQEVVCLRPWEVCQVVDRSSSNFRFKRASNSDVNDLASVIYANEDNATFAIIIICIIIIFALMAYAVILKRENGRLKRKLQEKGTIEHRSQTNLDDERKEDVADMVVIIENS